ncbi:BamA/TamA family outer membrane protein [Telmatocola sphagniphila]|uniref:BamA/TamA family outer membrane protein n=1 Tax=Telmatocola sphagniphila TaxID=1123043 RepID=A0A8E6B637_9BACT|nr:M1 family aminopeptidase [Telmatocola sphagniphila]QVL31100.1 BamA/TamA family outer membrane protein [Telmatocola sphagniphila]
MKLCCCSLIALLSLALPVLAAPPVAPEWLPKYHLEMQMDLEGHTVKVVQRSTIINHFQKPLDLVVFNVHSAFQPPQGTVERLYLAKMLEIMRVAASQGLYTRRAFDLQKVLVSSDGKNFAAVASHFRENNECALEVPLPKILNPGESVVVEMQYTFYLPQKQGRWGQWKGVTFLSNWCPVLAFYDDKDGWQPTPFIAWHQPWFNEAGVFDAVVNLPCDQVVACSGPIEKIEKENKVTATRHDVYIGPQILRDFAFICSNRFQEYAIVSEGVKVKCIAFPEHEHYAKVIAGISSRAIEQYKKWFGPFPYKELTLVESYFGWNGNECAGLIMVDERVFDMPKLAENYVEYLISHETCHQWWYNTIGTDGYRETFMDEAFATFFAHKLLDLKHGRNNALLVYPKELEWLPRIERENYRFSSFYSTLHRGELQPPLTEMQNYRHVGNLFSAAYDRGSKIIGIIEDQMGEQAFLEFMHVLYHKYYFRVLRARELQMELEKFTGRSWDEFFKRWLYNIGMTDWAVNSVQVQTLPKKLVNINDKANNPEAKQKEYQYKATVVLQQKAEYNEPTTLGVSFDGKEYAVRVPVGMVSQPAELQDPPATISPLPGNKLQVELYLTDEPKQITVDPDKILPDANPANNYWKSDPRIRLTPLYTFLDETPMTTDYHRWNITIGPWFYGPSYFDPWYNRSDIMGVRAGAYLTESFTGGVYAGYRTDQRDLAVGFDGVLKHWPDGCMETGFHAEKSLVNFDGQQTDIDRVSLYTRYIITPTSSLYTAPTQYIEGFTSWQKNDLPQPREYMPGLTRLIDQTNVGLHYHLDLLTPYWDPEMGARFDATYAAGLPILGESVTTQQVTAQLSGVVMPPEWTGWFSQTKLAWRAWGAYGGPDKYALFTLGGSELFRGFDQNERQGNAGWIGSLEWRVPILTESRLSIVDQTVGLRNLALAPFYDVGNMYSDGKSYGPPVHAVGVGLRMDVAWFSFIERTSLRIDIAKTLNAATPTQLWFGITHPF